MKARNIVTLIVLLLVPLAARAQQAQPQTPAPGPGLLFLFSDNKALKVGDVVTVIITQSTQATANIQRKSTNQVNEDSQRGTGFLALFPPTRQFQTNYQSTSGRQDNSSASLTTMVATTIAEMLPNGNMKIQGAQETMVDGRKQSIKVNGVIRPQDVRPDNTVLSTAITDAKIDVKGIGKGNLSRHTGGFFGPIIDFLKRPFDLLF